MGVMMVAPAGVAVLRMMAVRMVDVIVGMVVVVVVRGGVITRLRLLLLHL